MHHNMNTSHLLPIHYVGYKQYAFTRINQVPKTSLLKHCTSEYPKLLDDSHLPMKRTLQVSMELRFLIAI